MRFAEQVDAECRFWSGVFRLDIGKAQSTIGIVAKPTGGGHANHPVTRDNRFSTMDIATPLSRFEIDQLGDDAPLLDIVGGNLADEVFLLAGEETLDIGFDHGNFVGEFRPPTFIGLLHT